MPTKNNVVPIATETTQPTEAVVELSPQATPFKNTAVGKTVRTFFQNIAGVFMVVIPALIANEQFQAWAVKHPQYAWILGVLPAAGAFWTYVQNALDPTVPNR